MREDGAKRFALRLAEESRGRDDAKMNETTDWMILPSSGRNVAQNISKKEGQSWLSLSSFGVTKRVKRSRAATWKSRLFSPFPAIYGVPFPNDMRKREVLPELHPHLGL